jgi:hypothetical protein
MFSAEFMSAHFAVSRTSVKGGSMRKGRKTALIGATVVALGLGGAGIAHSQVATPKPTAKPTAKPKATVKPVTTPKPVKAAAVAKPVVTTPHHTG